MTIHREINLGSGRFWGGSLPLPAGWLSASTAFKTNISSSTLPYSERGYNC